MKKLTIIILLFAMVLSMLVPVGAAEGAKLVMSGNNVANAQSIAAGVIGAVGAVGAGADETQFGTALGSGALKYDSSKGPDKKFWEDIRKTDATEIHITTAEQLFGWVKYRAADYNANGADGLDTFEGVTIYLDVDVDLNGVTWDAIHGDIIFKGNFNGQGHVISNYKMLVGSWNKGFFGRVGGNATIQNLSLINVTYDFRRTDKSSNLNNLGVLVSTAEPGEGNTLTIKNVYVSAAMSLTNDGVNKDKTNYDIGGLIGVATTGSVILENCKFKGSIVDTANTKGVIAQKVGGLIGTVNAGMSVTMKNCEVDATLNVGGTRVGGLIGYSLSKNAITIQNCLVAGSVQSRVTSGSAFVGGLIGDAAEASTTYIVENTKGAATVETAGESTYAGGFFGQLRAKTATIDQCTFEGTVKTWTRCGGFSGYLQGTDKFTISNSSVNAVLITGEGLVGGIAANVNSNTADIEIVNCSVAGEIQAPTNGAGGGYAAGGILCRIYNTSSKPIDVKIANCSVSMDIDSDNEAGGGIIGIIRTDASVIVNDLTVEKCKYTGTLKSKSRVAGMIGAVGNLTGDFVLDGCSFAGTVDTTGAYGAGLVGLLDGAVAGDLIIDECSVAGTIKCKGSAGGLIGAIAKKITGTTTVDNCEVSATIISTSAHNGGFFGNIGASTHGGGLTTVTNCEFSGYIEGTSNTGAYYGFISGSSKNDYAFKNCVSSGAVQGLRGSGGFLGYFSCKNITMENIRVTGNLNLDADDGKNAGNNSVGGVIGRFAGLNHATLKNVVFSGTLNTTIAPAGNAATNAANVGGLIGYVAAASSVVELEDCRVNGALHFAEFGNHAFVNNKGMAIFIGGAAVSTSARVNVIYGQNVNYNLKALANATGHDVTLVGEGVPSMGNTAVLGYQIKWNKDETYDLRYIMGMKDVYDSIGVQAEIRYNFGEGVNVRYENVKVENVYKEVVDGESNTYRAADFAMDYLYTLTITNIPKEYAVHAGDLQVALIPYGISNGVTEFGVTTVQGDMGGFVELEDSDFDKEKPEAIDNALIHIYAGDYNVEETVSPATATATEVSGGKNVRHWYTNANTVLLYNFTVEEEGWYDAYFYLRLKNESVRSNQIVISNGETTETFTLFYVATSTHTGLKDSTNGTYLSEAFEIYLTPGDYTLTILPGWTGGASSGSLHYRDIYFVK